MVELVEGGADVCALMVGGVIQILWVSSFRRGVHTDSIQSLNPSTEVETLAYCWDLRLKMCFSFFLSQIVCGLVHYAHFFKFLGQLLG